MAPKEMGTDQMFILPTAEMAILGAEAAVEILYRKELAAAEEPEALRKIRIDEFRQTFCTPYHSASKQLVDGVIEPALARAQIIDALLMLETKSPVDRPWRKHGNMPL